MRRSTYDSSLNCLTSFPKHMRYLPQFSGVHRFFSRTCYVRGTLRSIHPCYFDSASIWRSTKGCGCCCGFAAGCEAWLCRVVAGIRVAVINSRVTLCLERVQRKLMQLSFRDRVDQNQLSRRVRKWQRETRATRIKEAVNSPAARAEAEARKVVSRLVDVEVAAARVADNEAAVAAARAVTADQSRLTK